MSHRFLGTLTVVVAIVLLVQIPATAQQARKFTPPRTAWGEPDLQGVYSFSTLTPMERPRDLAAKGTFTPEELAQLERENAAKIIADATTEEGDTGTYNAFWTETEKGKLTGRTSLILEPENGRQPALTPRAIKAQSDFIAEATSRVRGGKPYLYILYYSPRDMDEFTRCLSRPMPRIGQSYNHGIEVLQTPGQVVIYYESMHDFRVIPLDGRPHLDQKIATWNGDSRGHWEGQTLVIESKNFTDKALFADYRGFDGVYKTPTLRLTERLTRVDAKTINYEVTVDDPATWTKPWRFSLPWRSDDPNYGQPEDLYEYACHEGNYRMMDDALSGSRTIEKTVK